MKTDRALLEAALAGYRHQASQIEVKIADIRRQLATGAGPSAASGAKKRVLSAAARKRIAAAQRKRWAAYNKAKKAVAEA